MLLCKITRGGIDLSNNNLKRKPYFDPYIFRKVLEDVYLPPIAKELLEPTSVTHKQKFLFNNIRERFLESVKKEVDIINDVVEYETCYQFYEYMEYLNHSDEEKQRWFDELREQYELPSDYEFEE